MSTRTLLGCFTAYSFIETFREDAIIALYYFIINNEAHCLTKELAKIKDIFLDDSALDCKAQE